MNIVLVDDEVLVTRGLSQQIQKHKRHWNIIGTASNGDLAMELIQNHNVDVLVTDIRMPKKNGLELTREALQVKSELKIILLTGYAEFEYAQQAIRIGVIDYLLKPVDYMTLIEKISMIEKQIDITHKLSTVERAIRYIENNYYSPTLSLTEVADKFDLTPHHFSKLFKQEQGELFSSFLTRMRIEKAKYLLKHEKNLKVYEVGEQVGYLDRHYFNQLFKKNVGITPNQYKEEQHLKL